MNYSIFVRAKQVSFDNVAINRYYQLPSIENDEYSHYLDDGPKMNKVLRTIAQLGAKWIVTTNDALKLKSGYLSSDKKVWAHFLYAKMILTKHQSDLTSKRALLLYPILIRKSIDIGKVIKESILHCIQGSTTGGLVHSSLICGLCIQAGITFHLDKELQHSNVVINHNIYQQFCHSKFPNIRRHMGSSSHTTLIELEQAAKPSNTNKECEQGNDPLADRVTKMKQSMHHQQNQLSNSLSKLSIL